MNSLNHSRGFVTIATGKEEYYVLAYNLLLSYRFHNEKPLPFAIICDRENNYTAQFDDVILIDNPSFSYRDKFRLLDNTPYDETIYIDADSLVYRDLNGLWDMVKDSPDFGIFGYLIDPEGTEGETEIGRFNRFPWPIHFVCLSQGGMHFIRKTPRLSSFLSFCEQIVNRHEEIFEFAELPGSDGVFPLACSAFNWPPVAPWYEIFCFYRESDINSLDIRKGEMDYVWRIKRIKLGQDCFFVHFGLKETRGWIYNREVYRLSCALNHKRTNAFVFIRLWLKCKYSDLKRVMPNRFKTLAYKIIRLIAS